MASKKPLTYREAGVNIDAGNRLIEDIESSVASTRRPEVMGGLGGFAALFELPPERYRHPVLVSGTDGVGTKVMLGRSMDRYYGLGIDLVAMCVNDVLVQGAEPLFFLDYYATGELNNRVATKIIAGISAGCQEAGAALVGGETAELPGMYGEGEFDLAGFCVGGVEKDELIDGARVAPGDAIIGLAASGPHANGYSLIRRILADSDADLSRRCGETTLGEALIAPTRIYAKTVLNALAIYPVHALAHITGGGLVENLPRALPPTCAARIQADAWPRPAVFEWLREAGGIHATEMWRTFNCGIGMVLIVPPEEAAAVAAGITRQSGIEAWVIGSVRDRGDEPARVSIH